MSDTAFDKLAPFIQEYVYRNKWHELRDIQAEAIGAILDGVDHILISSGTATGKTEAALLPIITDLHNNPPATIGALYIGPLKALINDQFERITDLLKDTDIPAQAWHGDVAQAKKTRFLRQARGILQITPESLEAMLINRQHELKRLFGETRYIIIDEIHAFINSDRGRQVMCQLERLARYQKTPSRRIGLSATIGEPCLAMAWLRGNSRREAQLIASEERSTAEIGLAYFQLRADDNNEAVGAQKAKHKPRESQDALSGELEYFEHFHQMTQRVPKTLIFANARADTEAIVMNLRDISARQNRPSFYHVHHGSISAPLREAAEAAMKDRSQPACTAATITLELGIDLGLLDQVIQVNSTHTVSSFVQRLGRSGRRGGPARMFFYSTEQAGEKRHLGEELPWNLLQTIAIIQLYAEEKWIEPPEVPKMPLSLLYHQTMSIVKSQSDLSPAQLAERALTLSSFQSITQDQFRRLLRHHLEIEHLEQTEQGRLIIGIEAERIVNDYRFYAVFEDNAEYRVRDKSREIGTISGPPNLEDTIRLAGYVWRVLKIYEDEKVIEVERVRGQSATYWEGRGELEIHTRILRKIRAILLSRDDYAYLLEPARQRLQSAREAARSSRLQDESILPLAPNRYLVFPWCGTRQFNTQLALLERAGFETARPCAPYYYQLESRAGNAAELKRELAAICQNPPGAMELSEQIKGVSGRLKYDRFVPPDLLREAFARDYLDIPGAIESLEAL
ncbi:MAG: DEAD/DEAH box helicase [Chloroflexi bacterium]|nr:DEAD/DEAH box helicase [Chloroflexota bacterium]